MPDVNTIACVPSLPAALLGKGCCNATAPNTHTINKTLAPLLQHFPQCPGEFQLARQPAHTYFPAF